MQGIGDGFNDFDRELKAIFNNVRLAIKQKEITKKNFLGGL